MKHTVDIDFALNRAQRARRRQLVLAVLGLVFGVQIGLATWRIQAFEAERTTLLTQQRQLAGQGARRHSTPLTAEQTKLAVTAQTMLDSLAVPWDRLLQAVEAARPPRLLVEAMQPHGVDGSVSISVTSPDFATLAEFIQSLMQQPALQQVMLASEALPDNGGSTLRAVVNAHWQTAP